MSYRHEPCDMWHVTRIKPEVRSLAQTRFGLITQSPYQEGRSTWQAIRMSGQEANIVSSLIDEHQQARQANVGWREGAHLYLLQKFCVTLTVWSRFRTLCHQPLGMNTMSPGFCTHSMGRLLFCNKNNIWCNQFPNLTNQFQYQLSSIVRITNISYIWTITSIWREIMLRYLPTAIICS